MAKEHKDLIKKQLKYNSVKWYFPALCRYIQKNANEIEQALIDMMDTQEIKRGMNGQYLLNNKSRIKRRL